MIHLIFDSNHVLCGVAENFPISEIRALVRKAGVTIEDRHDWKRLAEVREKADSATAFMGYAYLPIDNGPGVHPRYDIVKAPAVGDEVGEGFNGDYYPTGKIVSITPTRHTIITDDGSVFTRRGGQYSAKWKRRGQDTFTLVRGHRDARNPEF